MAEPEVCSTCGRSDQDLEHNVIREMFDWLDDKHQLRDQIHSIIVHDFPAAYSKIFYDIGELAGQELPQEAANWLIGIAESYYTLALKHVAERRVRL